MNEKNSKDLNHSIETRNSKNFRTSDTEGRQQHQTQQEYHRNGRNETKNLKRSGWETKKLRRNGRELKIESEMKNLKQNESKKHCTFCFAVKRSNIYFKNLFTHQAKQSEKKESGLSASTLEKEVKRFLFRFISLGSKRNLLSKTGAP